MNQYHEAYLRSIENPLPELAEAFKAEFDFIAQHVKSNDNVLDVGCGNGRTLVPLSQHMRCEWREPGRFQYIVGIDSNPEIIALATEAYAQRGYSPTNPFVIEGDALNLHFEKDIFDLVYSAYNVIGLFNELDVYRFVGGQARVTKPKGYVINTTFCTDDFTREFSKRYYEHMGLPLDFVDNYTARSGDTEFHRVPVSQLAETYERTGLDIISVQKLGKIFMGIVGKKK